MYVYLSPATMKALDYICHFLNEIVEFYAQH